MSNSKKRGGLTPLGGCDGEPEETSTVQKVCDKNIEEKPKISTPERQCLSCGVRCVKIKRCKDCKSGCYCSKLCRDTHVKSEDHRILCLSIQQLEELENSKRVCSVREPNQVPANNKLVGLIGEKPLIECVIGGKVVTRALWDTGAMVSMITKRWLAEHFPNEKLLAISEFLEGDDLHLYTANNSVLAVEGVVVLTFGLGSASVTVPFVVSGDELSQPIIGYNVIKRLIQTDRESIPSALVDSIPFLTPSKAEAVVSVMEADVVVVENAKVMKKTVVPAHSRCRIRCHTSFRTEDTHQNVLFSPNILDSELEFAESVAQVKRGRSTINVVVSNPTNQPYVLRKGLALGSIEAVSAVIPVMPNEEAVGNKVLVQQVEAAG